MRSLRILLVVVVVVVAPSFLCARFILLLVPLVSPAMACYVLLATTHFPFFSSLRPQHTPAIHVMAYWAIARAGNEARHHPSRPRYNDIFCLTSLLYENISLTFFSFARFSFEPTALFPSGLI